MELAKDHEYCKLELPRAWTPWTFQFLKELTLQKKPDFIFLCEILCRKDRVKQFCHNVGFEGNVVVETRGHSGGIALLWRYKDDVVLKSYSKNHIDVVVEKQGGNKYRLTGIYGEPDRSKRKETWELIRILASSLTLPWWLIGDFNNVLSQRDKKGGRPYPQSLIRGFQEVVEDCKLIDWLSLYLGTGIWF